MAFCKVHFAKTRPHAIHVQIVLGKRVVKPLWRGQGGTRRPSDKT